MSNSLAPTTLVDAALELQENHQAGSTRSRSKAQGQFFTPPSVAKFMASFVPLTSRSLRVVDPGAGSGILSAALCDRVVRLRSPRSLHLVLYENDRDVLPALTKCLRKCASAMRMAGHAFSFDLHEDDFVLSAAPQGSLFSHQTESLADAVIMNPPYFKIGRDSVHAKAMTDAVHGQPNIYALFMSLGADILKPGGVLVAITPRSFCNGLYFRSFRRWFFERMSLEHVHLFESRTDTFRHAKVLQESLITVSRKAAQRATVSVTTSEGQKLPSRLAHRKLPSRQIVETATGDFVVRIPENPHDSAVIKFVEAWPDRLHTLGLRVSTGPVVSFRARAHLRRESNGATVPLLSVHNVHPFETRWPVEKGSKPTALAVSPESLSLVLEAKNYVLLRRFTAKEERRRLVASCFFRREATSSQVALENHLNYVYHADYELSDGLCLGLSALFNSALLDRYFRAISGNTQVNAAELRSMPMPPLATIERLGKRLLKSPPIAPIEAERAVCEVLGVSPSLRRYLEEFTQ